MSMEYIRRFYGVPAKRGGRVRLKAWDGETEGTITSATNQVIIVKPYLWPNARLRFHPTDLIYIEDNDFND